MTEQEIFEAALEHDANLRSQYLDEACGADSELRQRIENLLKCHEQAGEFFEKPAAEIVATAQMPEITEKPGTVIGPYKLLQQIGEGGMGVVYMAEQKKPVKRRVALKIIKPGMDTKQVIARFEAERQALAMMDHPNIAKVLDAGATESGRPYFVMELVNGISVTQYCDEQHLTPKERLELFVPICQAVQHAHQKGIIHRDLKPSNVLIALYDGRPVPKVIDFGVAKATSQTLTEKTIFTQLGQIVGTLEYMSPEQAQRNQLDIDTRSDIYSLGVLLYELLTGNTPFDGQRLRSAAFDEMLRIICEEEPPKPSTRVSSSEALPSIAANRHIEPRKLTALVRGELDWIVLKAMEKDRARRYETATGFAADIERYLQGEAVQACPPSRAYRFKKFAWRNKAALVTVALVVIALLLGSVGTTWQAVRATKAERLAQRRYENESEARRQVEEQRDRALSAEQRAQANFSMARSAVDEFLNKVTEDQLLSVPGLQPLRNELLGTATQFYEELTLESTDDPRMQLDMAIAYRKVGWIRSLLGQPRSGTLKRSLELCEALERNDHASADILLASAHVHLMLGHYDETITRCQRVLAREPDHGDALRLLASAYLDSAATAAAATMTTEERLERYRQAVDIREKLHQQDPNDARAVYQLGHAMLNAGAMLSNLGQSEEALLLYERSIEYMEKAYAAMPYQYRWGRTAAVGHTNMAGKLNALGRQEEALASCQLAIDMFRKLLVENPAIPELKTGLCNAHVRLGNLLLEAGDLDGAVYHNRKAVECAPSGTDLEKWKWNLAVSLQKMVWRLTLDPVTDSRDPKLAVELAKETVSLVPEKEAHWAWCAMGLAQFRAADFQEALHALDRATELGDDRPIIKATRALIQWNEGKHDEAIEWYIKAAQKKTSVRGDRLLLTLCAEMEELLGAEYRDALAQSYHGIAEVLEQTERPGDAEVFYRQAQELLRGLIKEDENDTRVRAMAVRNLLGLSGALKAQGKVQEARAIAETVLSMLEDYQVDDEKVVELRTEAQLLLEPHAGQSPEQTTSPKTTLNGERP